MRGAADVHVFDEADLRADATARTRSRSTSSSSLTSRMTTVSSLRPGKSGAATAIPSSTRSSSSNRVRFLKRSGRSVSRLTVSRWRPASRSAAACGASSTPLVVIARSRIAGRRRQAANQIRQVAAQQRFAAGQTDLVHAERREDVDQPLDLFEVEDVFARQPDVVRLRHAVAAAQVAAVGDRDRRLRSGRCWVSRSTESDYRPPSRFALRGPAAGSGRNGGNAARCALKGRGSSVRERAWRTRGSSRRS